MTLTLLAVSLNEQPLSQPITAVFDTRGGTIGRADHNTMTLPDPQRHVSRLQAEVVAHGREFIIRNMGAANPIVVGSRTLAHGETATLAADTPVRIGGYLLKVQMGGEPAVQPSPQIASPASVPEPVPAAAQAVNLQQAEVTPATPAPIRPAPNMAGVSASPFNDLLQPVAGVSSSNPFADLLGGSRVPTPDRPVSTPADPFADLMPPPAGVSARSAAVAPPPAAAPRLPDDFDPFAAPAAAPVAVQTTAPAADPFADLMPATDAAGSIDALFGLGGAASSSADPLAGFLAQPPAMGTPGAGATALPGLSTDPLALFGSPSAEPPAPMQPTQPDRLPALNAAWQPPSVQVPSPVPLPQSAQPAPAVAAPVLSPPATPSPASWEPPAVPERAAAAPLSAADAQALWAAFCRGAGVDVPVASHEVAARLQEVGLVLRSAVDGALQLMAVRASTKHELRAGVTVIQQRDNNPLKFSPDARSALEQMLQPPLRGFLEGPAAMDDAMHDLVGHAIGSVAGLRAAVEGMLDRFAPEALESKLSAGSLMDSLLPMNRRARLWDLYLQHHHAIREEAQEDFHTLFGKAFVAAYEQQIERLRREAAGRR